MGFGGAAFVHEVVDRGVGEEDACGCSEVSHVALHKRKDGNRVAPSSAYCTI